MFASILLSLGLIFTAPAPAAIQAPAAPTTYTVEQGNEWVQAELEEADMELSPNIKILFTNTANCGAEISATNEGGCTYSDAAGNKTIILSPTLPFTVGGHHVLFHELGHAVGYIDECEAENYAHQFEYEQEIWSYPTCEEQ